MAIAEFSIIPLGTGSPGLSDYVSACKKELDEHGEGLNYELNAMGIVIEGDLDQILKIIRRLHEVPFKIGAQRVTTSIKIDDRRDKNASINQKIKSVEDKLEEKK